MSKVLWEINPLKTVCGCPCVCGGGVGGGEEFKETVYGMHNLSLHNCTHAG